MPPTDTGGPSPPGKRIEDALAEFRTSKSKGANETGNHVRNTTRVVENFQGWARSQHDIRYIEDIDAALLKTWIHEHILPRIDSGDISARTGRQYINLLSAFLTYCEEWDWIDSNPAKDKRVKNERPEPTRSETETKQQTWSERERESLRMYADRRAHEAIDERGMDALEECRDRALVYLLAYTGARCGELVRDPQDSRRRGIYWEDIGEQTITVLGKNQDWQQVQYPEVCHAALDRYRTVLDPPTDSWPVFPTRHLPTLRKHVRHRTDHGDVDDPVAVLRDEEVPPPSITTETVRRILKRLCESDQVIVEGGAEYLQPHGARRGVGRTLYEEVGFEVAQKALRHADPQTTSEMYADIEASEVADVTDEVFKK